MIPGLKTPPSRLSLERSQMHRKMLACICGRKVEAQWSKGDTPPIITGCDHCAPINHDGTPRVK